MALRNRLAKVFEPPKVTTVKPPRKVYTYKRPRDGDLRAIPLALPRSKF
jgi:hypothetical protein